jgi:hypothetical protein
MYWDLSSIILELQVSNVDSVLTVDYFSRFLWRDAVKIFRGGRQSVLEGWKVHTRRQA